MKYVPIRYRRDMRLALISLLGLAVLHHCLGEKTEDPDANLSHFFADVWLEGSDVVKIIWRDCSKKLVDVKDVIDHKEYFPKFVRCMKRKTLRALDRSLSTDIVPLVDGVNLVRFEMVDRIGNIMADNETSSWTEKELDEGEWRTLALQRMAKVLRTHVIKFDFEDGKSVEKVESRGRRRHQMMTMMMFGVVSIGMVLVPMGFQFLAVLGGKALVLAKMALVLASIQGLKKVAASPVNYGFYHSYPPYDQYERRSHDNWPPLSIMPGTPQPALSINPWPKIDTGNVKVDRIHIANNKDVVTWRPELTKPIKKPETEQRQYPVFVGVPETSPPIFTAIDAPVPLADLTTRPGEVQADFTVEMPYNGFRFQSPTTVVSA